jgi:beta-galactosidase
VIGGLHDYVQIYIDRKLAGTLDRRLGQSRLTLPPVSGSAALDILVENSGRVNFTNVIRTERKGITGSVTIDGKSPRHWQIYSLPLTDLDGMQFVPKPCTGPCFYRFALSVSAGSKSSALAGTFLNTHGLAKGMAFLNGRPLGRFWSVGPEFTLYAPGSWLHSGPNNIVLFDLQGNTDEKLSTTDRADYGSSEQH